MTFSTFKKIFILFLFINLSTTCFSQKLFSGSVLRLEISKGFCGSSITLLSDSTYSYEKQCCNHYFVNAGTWTETPNTYKLQPYNPQTCTPIDSVVYKDKAEANDSINTIYFIDVAGNPTKTLWPIKIKNRNFTTDKFIDHEGIPHIQKIFDEHEEEVVDWIGYEKETETYYVSSQENTLIYLMQYSALLDQDVVIEIEAKPGKDIFVFLKLPELIEHLRYTHWIELPSTELYKGIFKTD